MEAKSRTDFSNPDAQSFTLKGGDHAVLLIHGFTGTPGHMRPLGDILGSQGFSVRGILLPGHGTTLENMNRSSAEQWLRSVLETAEKMKTEYRYVSIAGLSMGGVLALLAAELIGATACITISAPMKTRVRISWLAGAASLFVPYAQWHNGALKQGGLWQRYDYGYNGFPMAKVADLRQLMRTARHNLQDITCPLLAVQSHDDETIGQSSAETILRGVASSRKEAFWLSGVPHVCTLSPKLDEIANKIAAFLHAAEKNE